jgi:hypothetical protein
MNVNPDHMPPPSWPDYRHLADNRVETAILIWRIVAEFIGDRAPLPIDIDAGEPWAVAEDYIRQHAEEAEEQTWESRVIMQVLMDLSLADDYGRIKSGHQHMAFDHDQSRA